MFEPSKVERAARLIVSFGIVARFVLKVLTLLYLAWLAYRLISGTWTDADFVPLTFLVLIVMLRPSYWLAIVSGR